MPEQRPLQGRRALVTGAVGGLGEAFVRRLASAGADVVMTSLEAPGDVERQRKELEREHDTRVEYLRADLQRAEEIERLASEAAKKVGGIDILVNNAVVRHFAPIEAFPVERWDAALAVNISAAFHLTRLSLPGMRKGGYGRIFNITSVYGSRGTTNRVDYVTSKAAIEGLTRAIAMECADAVVTCHALCPGSVLTPSVEARVRELAEKEKLGWDEAQAVFLEGKQPNARFIAAESVSEVMLMLCGRVGRDMNGAIIPVEGGWLAKA